MSFRAQIAQLFRASHHDRRRRSRIAAPEVLESRLLLTAATSDSVCGCHGSETEVDVAQDFEVDRIELSINGESQTVSPWEIVVLSAGDDVQVVGIHYTVSDDAGTLDGIVAFEGYLSHRNQDGLSIDYSDGRFSARGEEGVIAAGEQVQTGLSGSWQAQSGMERLTLTMVRYFGNQSETVGRFGLIFQVEEVAINLTPEVNLVNGDTVTVGEELEMTAGFFADGVSDAFTYTEVDIYRSGEESPIWVGTMEARIGDGGSLQYEILNENACDEFGTYWIPEEAGEYVVIVTVDPENTVVESDESDNTVRLTLTVRDFDGDDSGDDDDDRKRKRGWRWGTFR